MLSKSLELTNKVTERKNDGSDLGAVKNLFNILISNGSLALKGYGEEKIH
jgi:hypothetical protein